MTAQEKKKEFHRSFFNDFVGILSLTVGVLITLCLYSYSPADASFNSASSGPEIHNLIGMVGAYTADFLIMCFGVASYFVAGIFFITGYLILMRRKTAFKISEFFLLFIFLIMTAVLVQLKYQTLWLAGQSQLAGGIVGHYIGELLKTYLSKTGSYVVVISIGLMAFLWATKISLVELAKEVGKFLWLAFNKLRDVITDLQIKLQQWLEIRAARREKNRKLAKSSPPKINLKKTNPNLETSEKSGDDREPVIYRRENKNIKPSKEDQLSFNKLSGTYNLPPISLLHSEDQTSVAVDEEALRANSRLLEKKLLDFGVEGKVTEIHPGPVVTMYEYEPASGVKVNRIVNLEDDLSLAMGGRLVRIVAPLPNKPAVGIEIPNHVREVVYLKDIISETKFKRMDSKIALALGKDIEGVPYVADLQKMPHLLIAGATGAGKSVCMNSVILSILFKAKPSEVRFIFIDPKRLELSLYEGIPHLLLPVVTEPKKAALALRWAIIEMERRYRLLADVNVRDIASYNKKFEEAGLAGKEIPNFDPTSDMKPLVHSEKLPLIVILVDEFADLMMVAGREVEEAVTRLAQMARAAGIHLIIATQRPSVDVITGVIKANFPARISFKVTSRHDARTILDTIGSEQLLGMGDMLLLPPGLARLTRIHGAFVSEHEITRVVKMLKEQGKPDYHEEILNIPEKVSEMDAMDEEENEMYDRAVAIVSESRLASISMIQRRLRIGYNRAARLIERMEQQGVVGPSDGAKGRQVLVGDFEN